MSAMVNIILKISQRCFSNGKGQFQRGKKLQNSDSLPYLHQCLLRQLRRFKGDEPLQAGGRSPIRRVSQAGGCLCSRRGWPPAWPGWGAHTHAAACGAQGAPGAAGAHCKETRHGGSVPARVHGPSCRLALPEKHRKHVTRSTDPTETYE